MINSKRHHRNVERNDKDASKPVTRHLNPPMHSKQHMVVCGLSLYLGSLESQKNPVQKNLSFKSALLIPTVSTNAYNVFLPSFLQ